MLAGSWVTATIAKDGTQSAEVDLGRPYDTLLMVIPTIDTAQVTIQIAEKSGGTFQDLYITDVADGGNNKAITASGTGALTWVVPLGGIQYIKVSTSAAQTTAAVAVRVCGVRE